MADSSILGVMERAKENIARFKKAKCMVLWLEHRISDQEKLHKDSVRYAKEYADSADRLALLLQQNKRSYEGFSKYIYENEDAIKDGKLAEELTKKLAKLQAEMTTLQEKLAAELDSTRDKHNALADTNRLT